MGSILFTSIRFVWYMLIHKSDNNLLFVIIFSLCFVFPTRLDTSAWQIRIPVELFIVAAHSMAGEVSLIHDQ